jgi:hypothetical protein
MKTALVALLLVSVLVVFILEKTAEGSHYQGIGFVILPFFAGPLLIIMLLYSFVQYRKSKNKG